MDKKLLRKLDNTMIRILFLGSKLLGFKVFQELDKKISSNKLYCAVFDDSKDSRSMLSTFIDYCDRREIDCQVVRNNKDLAQVINLFAPNLVLVCGYYNLIDENIIEKCPHGVLGIHASLLPKYRGNAPLVWAIINGETSSGVTLFFLDRGIDCGSIVKQIPFAIERSDHIIEVLQKANEASIRLAAYMMDNLKSLKAIATPQNENEASYCSKRVKEDGRIDWTRPSSYLYNFIRAQSNPYPGAFTLAQDEKKIICNKVAIFESKLFGLPGQVSLIIDEQAVIACGEGGLKISEIIIDGAITKATDYLKFNQRLI